MLRPLADILLVAACLVWSASWGSAADESPWSETPVAWTLPGDPDEAVISSLAIVADGTRLAVGFSSGAAAIVDAEQGTVLRTWTAHARRVNAVCFVDKDERLATASDDGTIRLWLVANAAEPTELSGHQSWVTCLAGSPNGRWLASGSYDRTVRFWDLQAHPVTSEEFAGHQGGVKTLSFSADGTRAVSAGSDRTAIVWDVKERKPVHTLKGHPGAVRGAAFSPDGAQVATAAEDGGVRLWNTQTGERQKSLSGHAGMIWCVHYADTGDWLASGGFDQTVRLWDPRTGQRKAILRGPTAPVVQTVFAPQGRALYVASQDRTIRRYSLTEPKP